METKQSAVLPGLEVGVCEVCSTDRVLVRKTVSSVATGNRNTIKEVNELCV